MGRSWQSPRNSGLYLSAAYTFARMPRNFSCLTLAIGVGVSQALSDVGASGVQLKWPNDLVLNDGKLGGILTEIQSGKGESDSECQDRRAWPNGQVLAIASELWSLFVRRVYICANAPQFFMFDAGDWRRCKPSAE